jgi:WD40 repeat protein
MASRQKIGQLNDGSKVNSVAFSPDGTFLATGDDTGNVELWNVTTGRRVATFDDRSSVYSVAFSPNGRTLATGDALGDVIPWDIASGTEVGPSLVDGNAVESIAFSPDGRTLVSGDDGGIVFLFPASFLSSSTQTLVQQLCNRIGGNFTPNQWAQYLPHAPYQKVCPANP